jgi:hypothetical protein
MSTATVTGTISFPVASTAPVAAISIGAPSVNPTSTTGHTVTFTEQATMSYFVAASGTQAINFGSIASGALVYVGTDQGITITVNTATPALAISAGGFALFSKVAITALSVTAGVIDANVQVMILGA